MTTFIRITLFIITLTLGQIQIATRLHDTGLVMTIFGNLPHRALGMLYVAHLMQPHRTDYAFDYTANVMASYEGERMLEGQKMPVIPMQIVYLAREFHHDKDWQTLSKYIMHRNAKGDYDNFHGYKEEETNQQKDQK